MRHVRLHAARDNNIAGYPNRITAACDNCAITKARCSEQKPCETCQSLDLSCTVTHQKRRRGQVQQQDQKPVVTQNTTAYVQSRGNRET